MDRPTRMVVTPGERLPRCCEYGAFPARSARLWSSSPQPCPRVIPPRVGGSSGPPGSRYGSARPSALRALPTPPVAAVVAAPESGPRSTVVAGSSGAGVLRGAFPGDGRQPATCPTPGREPGELAPPARARGAGGRAAWRDARSPACSRAAHRGSSPAGVAEQADARDGGTTHAPAHHGRRPHVAPQADLGLRRRPGSSGVRACRRRGHHDQRARCRPEQRDRTRRRRRNRGIAAAEAMPRGPVLPRPARTFGRRDGT